MKLNLKIKNVSAPREWNDKQTGELRKAVTILAEEISNEQYKDSFTIECYDKSADAIIDNFKNGDTIKITVNFHVQSRTYTDKEGKERVFETQRVTGFNPEKL